MARRPTVTPMCAWARSCRSVIENVMRFRRLRSGGHYATPEIGIAFVAMKRNIADLPEVHQHRQTAGRAALQSEQCAAVHGRTAR